MTDDALVEWLLEGDPALRWQVMSDLLDAPPAEVEKGRARVASEGCGARLLAAQDPDGLWAGALYSPKWTSTTYTLLLLQRLGLPHGHPAALTGCAVLWGSARFIGGGLTLAKSLREPETCITAMLVLLASAFGHDDVRVEPTVAWLLEQQLPDGGWNCEALRSGAEHSSFHTTISVLEALLAHQQTGSAVAVADAAAAGREFLLEHRLYRSHCTGEVVDPAFRRFPFPPQWHYDIVRALEHFRAAGAEQDDRLSDALEQVGRSRRADGTWHRQPAYPGRRWFDLEPPGPSRWATFRALRVLR